ncbi:hypothetical protein BKA63DRAFT_552678 [Paraphoma chrysanthemicola]|nr:hypothetical protein BKA63DRAFT_552678 [Paraphoma chrysanthemicola]
MLSFSPTHGVSYLIIPTLLGTAFAGGYHPYSSETLQCPSSVVYTTITPTTTITASTRVVTITVTPGGKDYLAKGQAYKTPEHKSSSFFISTLVEHKTPTVSPTPTPHSTPSPHPTPTPRSSPSPDPKPLDPDNPCPPAITAPTFGSITSTAFVTPLRTVTEIYEGEGTPAPPPTPPESKPDLGDPTIPAPPDPPPVAVPAPLNSPQNNPLVPGFSSPDFSPGGAPRPPDGLPAAQPAVAP